MKAQILAVNYKKGLAAYEVLEDNGTGWEYGWFEIIDTADVEVDEIVIGDFSDLGGTTILKEDTGETVDIFIQDFCSLPIAKRKIFE